MAPAHEKDARLKELEAAEARMAKDLTSGRMHDSVDFRIIYTYADGDLALAALERLADLAIEPVVQSSLRVEAIRVRARVEGWRDFESKARLAWRCLRGVSDGRRAPAPPSLIWRTSEEAGVEVRRIHARDIAVAYGRYLWKTGRAAHAFRVLRRVANADAGFGKHLAHTLMGLIHLEADGPERAAFHFVESLNVADDMWLHLTGYSRELLVALERAGVATPGVLAAREKLLKAPIPF